MGWAAPGSFSGPGPLDTLFTASHTRGMTLATLAAEHNMHVTDLAAYLDLGADYDPHATLTDAAEAEARDILAANPADAAARSLFAGF